MFTSDDVEAAMALLEHEQGICPGGCGQPLHESMHPDSEGKYVCRRLACHACGERQKTEADLRENPSDAGIHLVVERL